MDKELLASYGIDYDRGLKNCMGSAAFYKKILSMFLQDPCFAQAKIARAAGNQKELFSRMHELKGISGNAALMTLYTNTVPLVELLRGGNADGKEVDRLFVAIDAAHSRACEGIAIILAEP